MRWPLNRTWKQILAASVALVVGGLAAGGLMLSRQAPPREPREAVAPLVEVVTAERRDVDVRVEGYGTVRAKVRARVVPQVSGRAVSLHPDLVTGGFIEAGRTLLTIDPADYDLDLRRAGADLDRAKADQAGAEARIVEAETQMNDAKEDLIRTEELNREEASISREVRKAEVAYQVASAQLQAARANLQTAEARLAAAEVAVEEAELSIERTEVSLPFDAVVSSESVDVGQYLTAGQSVAEVYGTDAVEVPVPLEDRQLQWLSLPPMGVRDTKPRDKAGPLVDVEMEFGGVRCVWTGTVVRTEGEIDPTSRMVYVVVRVDDPREGNETGRPPLIPGAFVRVEMRGITLRNVIPLPVRAVRNDSELWVVRDGRLTVREVEVARTDRQHAYIASGLDDGAAVIVSPMDAVADGMKVRIAEQMQAESEREPARPQAAEVPRRE